MRPELKYRIAYLGACLIWVSGVLPRVNADEKPTDWMQVKLQMSQEILAGLTRGDLAAVETHAQKMNVVNFMEKLVSSDKPHYKEYLRQLQAFETANRDLLRQSAAKNTEGATLAYVQLTISCVQCHKLIRDAKK